MTKIKLRITRILNETGTSKTIFIKKEGERLRYRAGQFITIIFKIDNREIRRSYSFGSTPGVDVEDFITFKRIENGTVSRYLFDHIKEGDILEALPPAGKFTIEEKQELYFFIAAGSGITPVFSLIKDLLHKHHGNVILVYQNQQESQAIYRKQLLELKERFNKNFILLEFFSYGSNGGHQPQRINNYLLEQIVLKHVYTRSVAFFLCGPIAFMRMANFTLKLMGYKNEQIRKETFIVETLSKVPVISDTSPKKVKIVFNSTAYFIQVAYPNNILEVALQNNIELPYSCRGGRCSNCMATCTSGKVKMSINEVLTDKDLEKGLILTCVAHPETDVEIVFVAGEETN